MRQPSVYIPHGGGPCFFMEWNPPDEWRAMEAFLRGLVDSLPERPQAVLVATAHWEAPRVTVGTAARHTLFFDYTGFPPHTYALRWPVAGQPALARRVRSLLEGAGVPAAEDDQRGLDHGVFVPGLLMLPRADLPVVPLSLVRGLDPALHLAIGRALAPLRDEGVLLVGSGMSYHDFQGFGGAGRAHSQTFDAWLEATVARPPAERDAALVAWSRAPSGRASHPREEHLLPLHVVAGAAGQDPGHVVFRDEVMGVRVSAIAFEATAAG